MRPILAAVLSACLAASALPSRRGGGADGRRPHSVQTMGVDMGRATLQVDRATDGVTTRFRFENDALLGFVEASDLQMRSVVAPGRGKVLPKLFEGNYNKDDRVREVDLAYGAGGAIDGYQLIKRGRVRWMPCPRASPRARSTHWRRCSKSAPGSTRHRRAPSSRFRYSRPQALRCDTPLSRPDPGCQRRRERTRPHHRPALPAGGVA